MARKVFFSFHYKPGCWRASTVRNIGTVEGNRPVSDNDWEEITRGGSARGHQRRPLAAADWLPVAEHSA